MITFSKESYRSVEEQINKMVFVHAAETDLYQDKFTLNPDFDQYMSLEDSGMLRIFTAREDDELVGYLVFLVTYHPHYKDQLYANNDLTYVHPDYRSKDASLVRSLFDIAERSLKEEGVSVITVSMKAHMPFDKTAERMGYDRAEIVYSKYIKEEEQ